MNKVSTFFEKLITILSIYYIKLVYKTSKVIPTGEYELLQGASDEKFIIVFWHGDSYSLYPFLSGKDLYVITTKNKRGEYIDLICKHFGYKAIRVPDKSEGGNFLFKIRKEINSEKKANLSITLDGPSGPNHQPKPFPFITALLTKRKVLPLTINCKRKIQIRSRWDNFVIPLPFNRIVINIFKPLEVTKQILDNDSIYISEKIKKLMEAGTIKENLTKPISTAAIELKDRA